MSNRDGFTGGFIAGAAVGGLVGAVLGAVLSRRAAEAFLADSSESKSIKGSKGKSSQMEAQRMEVARLSLEDKISQLNQAIDDVRLEIRDVNGNNVQHTSQSSLAEDS
ncbi:MAG: hypothetical protein EAZ78_23100 [Oscillatoriales cyanobacterium]|uniref:Gas vesicle protein n=1 Tax=Microcoleus anatoxicus PTRS2 TaxID=2705321 RepID=A0ABU8YLM5_9CYAN|nr:MAG: hypothetical protein EA000_18820 [Oscillatoriales cyanobacterium]TAD95559.1 MAG: hypothetical protein EAZ98_15215 [Oscillatoriales cyanobacterium]TAE03252.1 MAG: hypothetical protein EAZ96_13520 [Oscillatoriales cyanobacterium]TAE98960.1 MAG: hypothetical protein EAZ78_23100 [Oscillatoriales cyanobacterium]TAF44096.1 MAG: hypothetical protein EAZ68_06870 [Oscillatoriales cyanobacterium]